MVSYASRPAIDHDRGYEWVNVFERQVITIVSMALETLKNEVMLCCRGGLLESLISAVLPRDGRGPERANDGLVV